jgi:uncharacterized membrane protein (UPF0136 family)
VVQTPMTSTVRLLAGVIGALFAPPARLYEMNAALGVVIVCVAFATTMEVMITTTVAMRMTPGRENFWIRILIAFILFGFLCVWGFSLCSFVQFRSAVISISVRMSILKALCGTPQNATWVL